MRARTYPPVEVIIGISITEFFELDATQEIPENTEEILEQIREADEWADELYSLPY